MGVLFRPVLFFDFFAWLLHPELLHPLPPPAVCYATLRDVWSRGLGAPFFRYDGNRNSLVLSSTTRERIPDFGRPMPRHRCRNLKPGSEEPEEAAPKTSAKRPKKPASYPPRQSVGGRRRAVHRRPESAQVPSKLLEGQGKSQLSVRPQTAPGGRLRSQEVLRLQWNSSRYSDSTTKESLRQSMQKVKERVAAAESDAHADEGDAERVVREGQKRRQWFQGTLMLKIVGAINVPCIIHKKNVNDRRTTMQCSVGLSPSPQGVDTQQHTKIVSVRPGNNGGTYAPEWQDAFCFRVSKLTVNTQLQVAVCTPAQSTSTRPSNMHGKGKLELGRLIIDRIDSSTALSKTHKVSIPLGSNSGQVLLLWKFHVLHIDKQPVLSQEQELGLEPTPFEGLALQLSARIHLLEALFTHQQEVNKFVQQEFGARKNETKKSASGDNPKNNAGRMSAGLNEKQFIRVVSQVVDVAASTASLLFRKVDANMDFRVSWDELLTYLMHENQQVWWTQHFRGTHYIQHNQTQSTGMPNARKGKKKNRTNADASGPRARKGKGHSAAGINRLVHCRDIGRFAVTTNKDAVQVWGGSGMNLEYNLALPALDPRQAMISAVGAAHSNDNAAIHLFGPTSPSCMEWVGPRKQLVVGFEDRTVRIYDLSEARSIMLASGSCSKNRIIHSFSIHDYGYPYCIHWAPLPSVVTGATTAANSNGADGDENDNGLVVDKMCRYFIGTSEGYLLIYDAVSCKLLDVLRPHKKPVTKIKVFPGLGLVSSSLDGSLAFLDEDMWEHGCMISFPSGDDKSLVPHHGGAGSNSKTNNMSSTTTDSKSGSEKTTGHRHGVSSFDYSPKRHFLVSVGLDRQVLVWEPHLTSRPASVLRASRAGAGAGAGAGSNVDAHSSPVVDVVIHDSTNHIITASSEGVIKVWDSRTLNCLQSFVDTSNSSLCALAIDSINSRLISAGPDCIHPWPIISASKAGEEAADVNAGSNGEREKGSATARNSAAAKEIERRRQQWKKKKQIFKKKATNARLEKKANQHHRIDSSSTKKRQKRPQTAPPLRRTGSNSSNSRGVSRDKVLAEKSGRINVALRMQAMIPSAYSDPVDPDSLVRLLYSKAYCQLLRISSQGNVGVWDLKTGRNSFVFRIPTQTQAPLLPCNAGSGSGGGGASRCDDIAPSASEIIGGEAATITSACLDPSGRRLLVGTHNGRILVLNFNNGRLLGELSPQLTRPALALQEPEDEDGNNKGMVSSITENLSVPCEISALAFIPKHCDSFPIIGAGWRGALCKWADFFARQNGHPTALHTTRLCRELTKNKHNDDVTVIELCGGLAASGDASGEIILSFHEHNREKARCQLPHLRIAHQQHPQSQSVECMQYLAPLELLLVGTDGGLIYTIDLHLGELLDDPYCINARQQPAAQTDASDSSATQGGDVKVSAAVTALATSRDCTVLCVGDSDGMLHMYRIQGRSTCSHPLLSHRFRLWRLGSSSSSSTRSPDGVACIQCCETNQKGDAEDTLAHPILFVGLAGQSVYLWDLDGGPVAQIGFCANWPEQDAIQIVGKVIEKEHNDLSEHERREACEVADNNLVEESEDETEAVDSALFLTEVSSRSEHEKQNTNAAAAAAAAAATAAAAAAACGDGDGDSGGAEADVSMRSGSGTGELLEEQTLERRCQVDDWKRKVSGMYATANAKSQAQSDKFAANSFGEYSTDTHSGSTERNDDTVHVLSQEELLAKSLSYAQKCPIFNPPSLDKEDRITLQLLEKYSRMSSSNQQQLDGRSDLVVNLQGGGYYKHRRTAQLATKLNRRAEVCKREREQRIKEAQHRALRSTLREANILAKTGTFK